MIPDYEAIFKLAKETVRSQSTSVEMFDKRLADFVEEHGRYKVRTDDEYHWIMTCVVFYSGMRARTVNDYMDAIRSRLYGIEKASSYGQADVADMLKDESMFGHSGKITASIVNAKKIKLLSNKYGSFQKYLDSFDVWSTPDNLARFRDSLRGQFKMLGQTTVYHFMTDIGLPVLKPDRVVLRLLHRLGLIDAEDPCEHNLDKAIEIGNAIASVAGRSVREVDIVFVLHGQEGGDESFGIERGVCLRRSPRCGICKLKSRCNFFSERDLGRSTKGSRWRGEDVC